MWAISVHDYQRLKIIETFKSLALKVIACVEVVSFPRALACKTGVIGGAQADFETPARSARYETREGREKKKKKFFPCPRVSRSSRWRPKTRVSAPNNACCSGYESAEGACRHESLKEAK